jgi:biopolymer transport protein TolQ
VELARIGGGADATQPAQPAVQADLDSVARALRRASNNEVTLLENLLPVLATTGSVAPFIGLFGTVWGVMNSFIGIGNLGNASLAVVAPGIAEALIATAIGLAAAIPAVMAYNYFVRRIRVLESELDAFASDYLNIVRRHFLG